MTKMESNNVPPEDAHQDICLLCQHAVGVLVNILYCSYHSKTLLVLQPQEVELFCLCLCCDLSEHLVLCSFELLCTGS